MVLNCERRRRGACATRRHSVVLSAARGIRPPAQARLWTGFASSKNNENTRYTAFMFKMLFEMRFFNLTRHLSPNQSPAFKLVVEELLYMFTIKLQENS